MLIKPHARLLLTHTQTFSYTSTTKELVRYLRVRAFFHKTVRVCHVTATLKLVSRVGLP